MSNSRLWRRTRRLLVTLAAVTAVAVDFHGDPTQFFTYFTILTNLLIAGWFLWAAINPEKAERAAALRLALTIYGLITLSVYWILLSPTHHPEGLKFVSNLFLHLFVPLAMGAEDLMAPWPPLRRRAPLLVLIFPVGYCAFAVIRGEFTGWYPYFFLDKAKVGGWIGLALFIVVLLVMFIVLAYGWRLAVHVRQKATATKSPS